MNKKKWNRANMPLITLALKLSEEAAEVGTIISDNDPFLALEVGQEMRNLSDAEIAHLAEELEQVAFIASVIGDRLESEIASRIRIEARG